MTVAPANPSGNPARKVVISLHDATPFHLDRMRRAESVFRDLGVAKIAYLFVPEYHGGYPAAGSAAFRDWCLEPRAFRIDWHLHGYHHLETGDAGAGGAGDFLKRKLLTAGEGEFLALDAEAQARKIEAGREAFRACLGRDPVGFVAPAWLFNNALPGVLKRQGFSFTEDQRRMYRVDTGARLDSPVITWATRTWLRKYGSLAVCPLLQRLWAKAPVLRIAMHPFDFDHPETVASIRGVLSRALREREQACAEELDFGAPAPAPA
jgi:predicted deacetylase